MADDCPKCPPVGAPLWLATFADLMSLLMCFFVLLLSFATMDVNKFKRMSESMVTAFGVQREIPATDIPMGTSVIAQHFSPAQTKPTPFEEIKQSTNQETATLDVSAEDMEIVKEKIRQEKIEEIQEQAKAVEQSLAKEIQDELVSVETEELKIIIRINEKGSFPSGDAILKPGFEPVMKKITQAVDKSVGIIHVAGHTDNIPISNDMYRSNWELAASRAVTVAQYILKQGKTEPGRIVVEGYAETKPLVPNDSAVNRGKNRRVEIIIAQKDPSAGLKIDDVTEIIKSEDKTTLDLKGN